MGLASLEFGFLEGTLLLEDWLNAQVEIVDVSTIASLKDSEVLAERSMGLEGVTTFSTEFEASAFVGLETDIVEDVAIRTEESDQKFIRFEFNGGFLYTWVEVGGSHMLATSDNHIWSVDEVVSLETKDKLVVVEDVELADLVDTTISLEERLIIEGDGVTVSLSSEEFVSGYAVSLETANPWEWVSVEVEVVDVSTETSTETGEVLAVWGSDAEWVTTSSTELVRLAVASLETDVVVDVTVSSEDFSDEFTIFELDAGDGGTVVLFSEVFWSRNGFVVTVDVIDGLETNDIA